MNVKAEMDALFMVISNSIMEGKPDVFLQAGWDSLRTNVSSLESRIAELKQIIDKLVEGIDSLTSEFPLEIEYIEAVEIAKDWKGGGR